MQINFSLEESELFNSFFTDDNKVSKEEMEIFLKKEMNVIKDAILLRIVESLYYKINSIDDNKYTQLLSDLPIDSFSHY